MLLPFTAINQPTLILINSFFRIIYFLDEGITVLPFQNEMPPSRL